MGTHPNNERNDVKRHCTRARSRRRNGDSPNSGCSCPCGSVVSSGQALTSLQVIKLRKEKRPLRHFRAITKYVAGVMHWVAEYFALENQKGHAMNLQKLWTVQLLLVKGAARPSARCDDIEKHVTP
jgi:hypothetical protein